MSNATARAKRPVRGSRSSQSRAESGLPWMKTTASRAPRGPDCSTRVPTPPTFTRDTRTPRGTGGSPTATVCSASVAAPSGPPPGVQYCVASADDCANPAAGASTSAATEASAAGIELLRRPIGPPPSRRAVQKLIPAFGTCETHGRAAELRAVLHAGARARRDRRALDAPRDPRADAAPEALRRAARRPAGHQSQPPRRAAQAADGRRRRGAQPGPLLAYRGRRATG